MKKYVLAEDNENGIEVILELTEEEFNETARAVRKKRVDAVQKVIKELAVTIGVSETKTMIREILREL